jgi:HPt (histidine-containing phosphotransfer) domain-containing protein
MHSLPSLDEQALAKLLKIGGPKFAGNMVDLFLGYAPTKLAEALAAEAKGDCAGVQDAMHPLKTSASHVGAVAVRALAVEIEQLARSQERARLPERLAVLELAMSEVRPRLLEQRGTFEAR